MKNTEKRKKVLEALLSASKLYNKEDIVPLIIESIRNGYDGVECTMDTDSVEKDLLQRNNTEEEMFLIGEMDYYLSELKKTR